MQSRETVEARRRAFQRFVDERGGIPEVVRATGVAKTTFYSYLNHKKSDNLSLPILQKVASAFDVSMDDIFLNRRMVPIVGYVGAGAKAHYYEAGQGPFNEVEAPDWATDKTVAVQVQGESLGSWFQQWIVFYDDVRSPVTPDLLGEVCIVGLSDGRVLIKKIEAGRDGGYHLMSQFEPPIYDVDVLWAAKVKEMRPR